MNRVRLMTECNRIPYTGKGVTVAILDSGIYPHIDFSDRIIGFCDVLDGKVHAYDNQGHGTHIGGIIGGSGEASRYQYQGIAPDCNLVAVKALDRMGNGEADDVVKGIQWVIKNKERYRIRILNLSVGTLPETGRAEKADLVKAVDTAWDAGLVVVVAAGNNGPSPMSITTPGISRKVITVGCSEDESVFRGKKIKTGLSGRGPTPFCITKPEILAPGRNVMSCKNVRNEYVKKSGTSMATAVVSGGIALLLEKWPELSPKDVKLALKNSTTDLGWEKNRQGWGALNLRRLLR